MSCRCRWVVTCHYFVVTEQVISMLPLHCHQAGAHEKLTHLTIISINLPIKFNYLLTKGIIDFYTCFCSCKSRPLVAIKKQLLFSNLEVTSMFYTICAFH